MNSVTYLHIELMKDSREIPEGARDVEFSTCAKFTSSLASGEVWVVLFSLMRYSSY